MAYTGTLFGTAKKPAQHQPQHQDIDKLVKLQVEQLRHTYGVDCLDAKQLQQVLNVGESNVYQFLKDCKAVRVIGHRKVVPIVWVAYFLVTGTV